MTKPTLASDWLAGCSGCHMSFLDIDERIAKLIELVDLRATPITDLKHPDKEGVTVGVLEGGINNSFNEKVAKQMRERCKMPAMRNFFTIEESLRRAYIETPSTDSSGKIPSSPELAIPTRVRAVHEVVPVDVFIPGCPPDADIIFYALSELAQGRLPKLENKNLMWN